MNGELVLSALSETSAWACYENSAQLSHPKCALVTNGGSSFSLLQITNSDVTAQGFYTVAALDFKRAIVCYRDVAGGPKCYALSTLSDDTHTTTIEAPVSVVLQRESESAASPTTCSDLTLTALSPSAALLCYTDMMTSEPPNPVRSFHRLPPASLTFSPTPCEASTSFSRLLSPPLTSSHLLSGGLLPAHRPGLAGGIRGDPMAGARDHDQHAGLPRHGRG